MKNLIYLLFFLISTAQAQTLNLALGKDVSNSLNDGQSPAWMVSETFPVRSHYAVQVGYMNEGHQVGSKRDGITVLGEYKDRFTPTFSTAAYLGPYITSTTEPVDDTHYRDAYRTMLIAGYGLREQVSHHVGTAFRWLHVMSFHSKDADVFLMQVGYRN